MKKLSLFFKMESGFVSTYWNKSKFNVHHPQSLLSGTRLLVSLVCLQFATILSAFAQEKIGTVDEFRANLKPAANGNARQSKNRQIATHKGSLNVLINYSGSVNGADLFFGGVQNSGNSHVSFQISGNKLEGFVAIPSSKEAYRYSSDNSGNVLVEEADIHEIMCIDYDQHAASSTEVTAAAPPAGSTAYTLQSLPGVTAVAYLDFDGEYVSGTSWNSGNPIDAQPSNFSEADITNIWKIVSEDYRAFNINITTDLAVFNAAPKNRRMRCIFTPTTTAAPGSGGVAYLNSFANGNDNDAPCWVFNGGVKSAGEAGSHELGHTFGLAHDGRELSTGHEEYYRGQGLWAPIMGASYYNGVTQWSIGDYTSANNFQDDIAIISNTTNGFGFKTDESGSTAALAKALTIGTGGTVPAAQNYGIIANRSDVDVYKFTTGGGTVTLQANPSPTWPDLDILLTLSNAAGTVLATANPAAAAPSGQTGSASITGLNASITMTLAAGTYYLSVDGTGQDDPKATGYSDYGSTGEYTISGTVPTGAPVNQTPVASITSPANGSGFNAPATIAITANASDADGTISKVDFYNGSVLLGSDATAPYSYTISSAAAGTYSLKAVATDNQGATGTSAVVTVTVNTVTANQAPSASITSPANGSGFNAPATIAITASASDADGTVSKVDFYNGSVLLGSDATAPYSFTISSAAAGTYSLKAVATDNGGATGSSAIVTVTVNNISSTIGISGPSCTNSGVAANFSLTPEAGFSSCTWWTSGDATTTVDPADSKKAKIVYTANASGTVTVSCGVNYNAAPWYKEYSKTVQVGNCPAAAASAADISTAPHPFTDQTTISVNNGEKILSARLFDLNGKMLMNTGHVEIEQLQVGSNLTSGIYLLHLETESGTFTKRIIKIE